MATYGFGTPGQVPFTGYTNTLGVGAANQDAVNGYAYYNGLSQGDDKIIKALRNGGATRTMQAVWYALTGAAVGGTATASYKRIQGVQGSPGGLQIIETVTPVNRVTTTADRTAFQALMTRTVFPATYPADVGGNGGGGKGAW